MYYFQWNKALYDYYFESDMDSVVLYVDDDVIESIGREFHLPQLDNSYLKSFLSSTIVDTNGVSLIWNDLCDNQNLPDSSILKPDISDDEKARFRNYLTRHPFHARNSNINNLAAYLLDVTNSNNTLLSCPLYLGFMITIILAAQHQPHGEQALHNFILNFLNGQNRFGFNAGINQTLARQFYEYTNSLNRFNNAFDASNAKNRHINIGKIKYHLILSNNERDRIQELLYRHNLNRWDEENVPYQNIINQYIMPNLGNADTELRNVLINTTMSADIVKNILRNYSYTVYQRAHNAIQNRGIRDSFYFILNLDNVPKTLSLGTMYTEAGSNDQLILHGSEYGAEYGLYPVEARVPLSWGTNYEYASANVRVSTLDYNNLAYFEQIPASNVFIQIKENRIVQNRNYLVVIPQDMQFNHGREISEYYQDVFPESSVKFLTNLYDIINFNRPANIQHKTIEIPADERKGIKSPRYQRNYYYFSLNYYHINNYQPGDNYEIQCWDEDRNERIQAQTYVTRAGDVFVDISWDDNIPNRRCRFTLLINGEEISNGKVYNIIAETGTAVGEVRTHFKFDGWGRRISDEQQTDYYSNGNIYTGNAGAYDLAHRVLNIDWYEAKDNDFLLLDLITCVGEDTPNWINDKILSYIIQYVATRKGFPGLSCKQISVIKSALMELGYLDRAFDERGQEIFQVNDLRIVPSTKQFAEDNDAFLLFGGFTRKKRHEIMDTIGGQGIIRFKLPYHNSLVRLMPYLAVLPPFILVNTQAAKQLSTHLGIENRNLWNINGFVNFIKGIGSFETVFIDGCENPWDNNERNNLDQTQLPRYVMDQNLGRIRLETTDGKYSHYYYNQRRIPIPSDLIRLYCQNSHGYPVIIVDEPEDTRHPHYDKVYFTKEMGVPYLLKRLFCTLNLGLQQEEYAFIVDHLCITDPNKQWYTAMRSYDVTGISDPLLRVLIGKLSSRTLYDDLTSIENPIIVKERSPQYSMKLYRNRSNYAENYLCLFEGDTMLAYSMPGDNSEIRLRNTNVANLTDFGAFYIVFNRKNEDCFVNDVFSRIIRLGDFTEYVNLLRDTGDANNLIPDSASEGIQRLTRDFDVTDITIVLRTNI